MPSKIVLVITSIADASAPALNLIAAEASRQDIPFILIGDEASPPDFDLAGCSYFNLKQQEALDFSYAPKCPRRSYARKNIGYLIAARAQAEIILETDDDTFPYTSFWQPGPRQRPFSTIQQDGWVNVYKFFSDSLIWPRGLPLPWVHTPDPIPTTLPQQLADCPVQQGLVNDDPDVDACYRMLFPQSVTFDDSAPVCLAEGTWTPFNSQNTAWWRPAFALMYLPATCPMRLTDIWRSLVAQRVLWTCGWQVAFHSPTARQQRNPHDLFADFQQEVPGHLHNETIRASLMELPLKPGPQHIDHNVFTCYQKLVSLNLLDPRELELLTSWQEDMAASLNASTAASLPSS